MQWMHPLKHELQDLFPSRPVMMSTLSNGSVARDHTTKGQSMEKARWSPKDPEPGLLVSSIVELALAVSGKWIPLEQSRVG